MLLDAALIVAHFTENVNPYHPSWQLQNAKVSFCLSVISV